MGRIVIAGYRPKPGKSEALRALVGSHLSRLRAEGLVTARAAVVMEAEDGTILEVFEWRSKEAIVEAHDNDAVQAMWQEFAAVCDYVPVADVAEAQALFSEFSPLDP
jgi:quinol monooxygenase YgiN